MALHRAAKAPQFSYSPPVAAPAKDAAARPAWPWVAAVVALGLLVLIVMPPLALLAAVVLGFAGYRRRRVQGSDRLATVFVWGAVFLGALIVLYVGGALLRLALTP